jgi:imidazolonepropionase-like amidohydrolase
VDSVEHGCRLSEDQLVRMADQGTTLVVTMGVGLAFESHPAVPEAVKKSTAGVNDQYREVLQIAHRVGVHTAVGSDGVHGTVAEEMGYLVQAGYSPVEALTAGTANGAELVCRDDLGHLREGSAADIVFIEGDPTADIAAAAQVRSVLRSGRWLRPLPAGR